MPARNQGLAFLRRVAVRWTRRSNGRSPPIEQVQGRLLIGHNNVDTAARPPPFIYPATRTCVKMVRWRGRGEEHGCLLPASSCARYRLPAPGKRSVWPAARISPCQRRTAAADPKSGLFSFPFEKRAEWGSVGGPGQAGLRVRDARLRRRLPNSLCEG